jgi:hypothetical protein
MAILKWCRLCAVLLLLFMQACATRPVGVSDADASWHSENSETPKTLKLESQNGLALFPAVQQLGVEPDRLAAINSPHLPGGPNPAIWQHFKLPGKQPTHYSYTRVDGKHAVMATASSSASMLRHVVRVEPPRLQDIVFSWKIKQLIRGADLTRRETHDSPVRLVLAFEGDRSEFSMKNAMLSELMLTLTGEPMPYATLMYVWCNACAKETVLVNPRTDRIREIVLETGPDHIGQWLNYQRDIQADYLKAYGQTPGALVGIGLMTDTDNTRQSAVAWYGPVSLTTHLTK